MKFRELVAKYELGILNWFHLPEIAYSAIQENIESESLIILAGMNDKDPISERKYYFEKGLKEIDYKILSKLESAEILLKYYLEDMISNPISAYETMILIDNEIYKQLDWKKELGLSEKMYVGEELGLQKLYTWYREIQDWYDKSSLFYYNDLPKDAQKIKFEEHLIEEAKNALKTIETMKNTHNIL
jgi:hypothetical protein